MKTWIYERSTLNEKLETDCAGLVLQDFSKGVERNWHFSRRTLDSNTKNGVSHFLLASPNTFAESIGQVHNTIGAIYQNMIDAFINNAKISYGNPLDGRSSHILFGHIALLISRRLSKSRAQLTEIASLKIHPSLSVPQKPVFEFACPLNSKQAISLVLEDKFGTLLDYLEAQSIFPNLPDAQVFMRRGSCKCNQESRKLFDSVLRVLTRLLAPLMRRSPVVITRTYLGITRELRLASSLSSVPQISQFGANCSCGRSEDFVVTFRGQSNSMKVEDLIAKISTPRSLGPSLHDTVAKSQKMGMPKSPKAFFVSNGLDVDDFLKSSMAISKDSKVFIGQHGNNFGVSFIADHAVDFKVCDIFFSWGWTNENKKITPVGQIKKPIKTRSSFEKKGSANHPSG